MDISAIFEQVASKMRSDLELTRKALRHAGLKGSSAEETFRKFLRDYLPRNLDISTGILVDSHKAMSRQIDVIISDAAKTPIFFSSGDIRVIPVECAYAAIEVKTFLDSKELGRCFENMNSIRKLKKSAYFTPAGDIRYPNTLYGKEWSDWPISYYIFSYDSVSLREISKNIQDRHQQAHLLPWSRIDSVCVLDKGVICNRTADGMIDALPSDTSEIAHLETDKSLLLFFTLVSRYLNQANMPNFRFNDYLGELNFGNLEIPR